MPIDIEGQEFLTQEEVAERVGVTRQTVWRWKRDGLVPQGHRYRGHNVVFSPAEVKEIEEYANRIEPIAPALSNQLRLFDSASGVAES